MEKCFNFERERGRKSERPEKQRLATLCLQFMGIEYVCRIYMCFSSTINIFIITKYLYIYDSALPAWYTRQHFAIHNKDEFERILLLSISCFYWYFTRSFCAIRETCSLRKSHQKNASVLLLFNLYIIFFIILWNSVLFVYDQKLQKYVRYLFGQPLLHLVLLPNEYTPHLPFRIIKM